MRLAVFDDGLDFAVRQSRIALLARIGLAVTRPTGRAVQIRAAQVHRHRARAVRQVPHGQGALSVRQRGQRSHVVHGAGAVVDVGEKEHRHTRIEPLISLQWWCRMDELKQPAIAALNERAVAYHPESQHRFAIASLEDAPDWNISRQIWWGHQLPVWYCPDGHVTVAETDPPACAECGSTALERETDVLDTWFSSALWPFATLGWPDETPDLAAFYPGDLQTTAREIIRL